MQGATQDYHLLHLELYILHLDTRPIERMNASECLLDETLHTPACMCVGV